MKWCAFCINYDDALWLKNSAPFMLENFDEVIIVDGADKVMAQVKQADGKCPATPNSGEETQELYIKLEQMGAKIIHPTGFWDNKTQMCNAAYDASTADYLWQIDSDEFYHADSVLAAKRYMEFSKKYIGSVPITNFWKNFNTFIKGGMWKVPPVRIFKKTTGMRFGSHRPPNLTNGVTTIYAKDEVTFTPSKLMLFHAGYLGDERVWRKSKYYVAMRPTHPQYSKYMEWFFYCWRAWDDDPKAIEKKYGLHITGKGTTYKCDMCLPDAICFGQWPKEYWEKYPCRI